MPSVDVFVSGAPVLEGVDFGAVSDYLELPADAHTVDTTVAGDPAAVVGER